MQHRFAVRALVLVAALAACSAVAHARPDVPWRLRRRPYVRPNRASAERVPPELWPAEPPRPSGTPDPVRFAQALRTLCGWMPRERPRRWTEVLLREAAAFEVDPFLLGALVHRMSRCKADAELLSGYGATLIPLSMLRGHLRRGRYRYYVRQGGDWVARYLDVPRAGSHPARLRRFAPNVHLAAGLLRAFREQHPDLDRALPQAPHRHFVSHFVWGDRVPSSRAEDRILLGRRRLLQYYGAYRFDRTAVWHGLRLASPLDGGLRVVSSFPGDAREGGARRHRGIDIEAVAGEPVRAQAAGRVVFAGVDLPGARHKQLLDPEAQDEVPRAQLGRGGRFVCVRYDAPQGGWLKGCYMHLQRYVVRQRQRVARGEVLGYVGRTGMRVSAPHLHLELGTAEGRLDPAEVLAPLLVGERPVRGRRRARRRPRAHEGERR